MRGLRVVDWLWWVCVDVRFAYVLVALIDYGEVGVVYVWWDLFRFG